MVRANRSRRHQAMVKPRWWIGPAGVLIAAFAIALGFYIRYDHLNEYFKGVATNTAASFLDVLLIVIGLGLYEQLRRKNEDIARLHERIGDVKKFDDPRAHGILAAAIRGLAKFGRTDIDLRGAHLTNFSFSENGIRSIAGAVVSDCYYPDDEMKNFAELCSVSFAGVNCNGVCFSSGGVSTATLVDCDFHGATLIGATFDGALMRWSIEKVVVDEAEWEEVFDEDEKGNPITAPKYMPAFAMADLTDCSFKCVQFQNIDFRGALNVGKANFAGARGLETCHFDKGQR